MLEVQRYQVPVSVPTSVHGREDQNPPNLQEGEEWHACLACEVSRSPATTWKEVGLNVDIHHLYVTSKYEVI